MLLVVSLTSKDCNKEIDVQLLEFNEVEYNLTLRHSAVDKFDKTVEGKLHVGQSFRMSQWRSSESVSQFDTVSSFADDVDSFRSQTYRRIVDLLRM